MRKEVSLVFIFCFSFLLIRAQIKIVTLDNFFNNEYRKNDKGEWQHFHYLWEDSAESGYSNWGKIFQKNGFELKSLPVAPTKENLKGTAVYLIVDPDTENETAHPNFILPEHVKAIASFVNKGGVLVIMANDSLNVEFEHLNKLTEIFGIHLNGDSKSKVIGNNYDMGAFIIPNGDPIFTRAHKVYLKDVSSLTISKNAMPILKHQIENYIVGAKAKYGKGTVVVIGDPWFYNEYLNGHLGNDKGWDNALAAEDFTIWLLNQSK